MEVQRAQPCRDVSVHFVFNRLPVDAFVTIRALTSGPGTHTHTHHPRTVLDRGRSGGERSRNPVRCIHVCKPTRPLKPGRTITEAVEWAVSASVTVSCQNFLAGTDLGTVGPRPFALLRPRHWRIRQYLDLCGGLPAAAGIYRWSLARLLAQGGNNNACCHDNEISCTDWNIRARMGSWDPGTWALTGGKTGGYPA